MAMAALLLIAEILTTGFFLLWFSIGAASAGILALLGVGRPAQIIVFVLVSGILFVFGRRFAERVTEKQPPGIGADRFIGIEGRVLEKIHLITPSKCPHCKEKQRYRIPIHDNVYARTMCTRCGMGIAVRVKPPKRKKSL